MIETEVADKEVAVTACSHELLEAALVVDANVMVGQERRLAAVAGNSHSDWSIRRRHIFSCSCETGSGSGACTEKRAASRLNAAILLQK